MIATTLAMVANNWWFGAPAKFAKIDARLYIQDSIIIQQRNDINRNTRDIEQLTKVFHANQEEKDDE